MGKTSSLIKNTAIIGFGTMCTKALTFVLLPLYTNVLDTQDYGLVDVLLTMSFLIVPFAALEMNSGVFRFLIGTDKDENISRDEIISTGLAIEFVGLLSTVILLLIIDYFVTIPHFTALFLYVFSLVIANLTLDTTRGFGDTIAYSISNVIITLTSLLLNIVLILVFRWGAVSILIASALGNFLGAFFLIIKEKMYKYVSASKINRKKGTEMLKFTIPLIPNTISWWVASASDRLVVLTFLGASANGIYAAAHKIPGIYTTLFSVFCLAWTESVARNSSDKIFVERTMKKSVNIMIFMLLGIASSASLFFDTLIGDGYVDSYWHILILLIAIFFSSLSSLYGGIFGGKMDSKSIACTTVIGAVINIIVNLGMVKIIGLYAASLSTMISYMVISVIRGRQIKKWYNINLFTTKDVVLIPLGILCILGYYYHNFFINVAAILAIVVLFFATNNDALSLIRSRICFKKQ